MPIFSKKKIQRTKTLGERLRKVREELGRSLEEAEQATQIKKKYLIAIEQGNYASLPGPVYIESFLKKYSVYLGVSENFVLDIYRQQEKKILKRTYQPQLSAPGSGMPQAIITPRLIRFLIIGLVIAICLSYIGFEVVKIFSPPKLSITSPIDNFTTDQNSVEITGITDPGIDVTINGRLIYLDDQGNFLELVNLKEGVNLIQVSASKKRSEPTVVERRIFYKSDLD